MSPSVSTVLPVHSSGAAAGADARIPQPQGLGLRLGLLSAVIPFFLGCAQVEPQTPTHADRPLRTVKIPERSGGIVGTIEQEGLDVAITASYACRLREDRVVRRVTTTEHRNLTPTGDWWALGASIAAIGAGAVLTADASRVHPKDSTSRTYNSTGPGAARTWGIVLLAGGGVLLSVPVVDAVRASQTTLTEGDVTIEGEPTGDEVACPAQPATDMPVMLTFADVKESIGTTSKRGELEINLDEALDRGIAVGRLGKGQVLVGDAVIGAVQLKPLLLAREARAWAKVPRGLCRTPTKPTDCNEVLAFLRQYPDGPHVAEAKQVLQEGQPKADRLADDAAWSELDLGACTKGRAGETAEEAEASCESIRAYRARYPNGLHADEAAKAIEAGHHRAEVLRERRVKAAKDAEAKAAREAKEAEDREAKAERRKCEATCRLGCSSWTFRGREATCFSACVETRCNP